MRSLLIRLTLFLSFFISLAAPTALRATTGVPSPDSVFGFQPGADFKLATYEQSLDYFQRVAAASKYVKLVMAGSTSQGRPMYFALVSSPDNLS